MFDPNVVARCANELSSSSCTPGCRFAWSLAEISIVQCAGIADFAPLQPKPGGEVKATTVTDQSSGKVAVIG